MFDHLLMRDLVRDRHGDLMRDARKARGLPSLRVSRKAEAKRQWRYASARR
jgi:hypothetical protein